MSVTDGDTINLEITIENDGQVVQDKWLVGAEAWFVNDFSDPWNTRSQRQDSYANGWDNAGGSVQGTAGVTCTPANWNDILVTGTRILTCTFPTTIWDPTSGSQRIMFWLHVRDLDTDKNSDLCSGDSNLWNCGTAPNVGSCTSGTCPGGQWWTDAMQQVQPAAVKVIIVPAPTPTATPTLTPTPTPIPANAIVLSVQDKTSMTADENAFATILNAQFPGQVTIVNHNDIDKLSYSDVKVVVITTETNYPKASFLQSLNKPVVSTDRFVSWLNFVMSDNSGSGPQIFLRNFDQSHLITCEYSGDINIYTASGIMTYLISPKPDVTSAAKVGSTGNTGIGILAKDARGVGNPPDKRLHFAGLKGSLINAAGEDLFVRTVKFAKGDTLSCSPRVTTNTQTLVEQTKATLNGNLDRLGTASPANVYFQYRKVGAPSWATTSPKEAKTATGSFSKEITGLTDNTQYEFKACADGSTTVCGSTLTFTTACAGTDTACGLPGSCINCNLNDDSAKCNSNQLCTSDSACYVTAPLTQNCQSSWTSCDSCLDNDAIIDDNSWEDYTGCTAVAGLNNDYCSSADRNCGTEPTPKGAKSKCIDKSEFPGDAGTDACLGIGSWINIDSEPKNEFCSNGNWIGADCSGTTCTDNADDEVAYYQCIEDDGFCGPGCNANPFSSAFDNDCSSSCGNGEVEPGEQCEGTGESCGSAIGKGSDGHNWKCIALTCQYEDQGCTQACSGFCSSCTLNNLDCVAPAPEGVRTCFDTPITTVDCSSFKNYCSTASIVRSSGYVYDSSCTAEQVCQSESCKGIGVTINSVTDPAEKFAKNDNIALAVSFTASGVYSGEWGFLAECRVTNPGGTNYDLDIWVPASSGQTKSTTLSKTLDVSGTWIFRYCAVKTDFADNGGWGPANTYNDDFIVNSAPAITSVTAAPDVAKTGASITMAASGAADADNDNLKLECGDASGKNNLCIGSYSVLPTQPSCSFTSTWVDNAEHTVYCRAFDGYEYSSEVTDIVTADNTAPSVTSVTSVGGDAAAPYVTNDNTPDVIFSTNENSWCRMSTADQSYDIMGAAKDCSAGQGTASHTCISPSLADGSATLYIACKDAQGNSNTAADNYAVAVTVDTTAPATSLTSVEGDATSPYYDTSSDGDTNIIVSGETGMSCRWYDTDVAYNPIAGTDCLVSGTDARCTVASADGIYTKYISCADSLGNGQSASQNNDVSWTVDYTAPAVDEQTSFSDTNGYITNSFTVKAKFSDATSGIDAATCQVCESSSTPCTSWIAGTYSGGYCSKAFTKSYADGTTVYGKAKIKDLAGNQKESNEISKTTDITAPSIGSCTVNKAVTRSDYSSNIEIRCTIADAKSGVKASSAILQKPDGTNKETKTMASCGAEYCANWKPSDSAWDNNGDTVYIDITAADNLGNSGSVDNKATIIIDNANPAITSLSRSHAYPTTSDSVAITAAATDANLDKIEVFVDGLISKTCNSSPCSTNAATYSWGTHTYYALATDKAGNIDREPDSGSVSFNANDAPSTSPATVDSPSGQCKAGETVTLKCTVADSNQAANTLTVYVWAGQCDAADCFNTRAWATGTGTVYYKGYSNVPADTMTAPPSGGTFTKVLAINQPVGSAIATTCQPLDSYARDDWKSVYPWGDAYPVCTVGGCINPPVFNSIQAAPEKAKAGAVSITFTASAALQANPAVLVKPGQAGPGIAATFVSKNGMQYTYSFTVLQSHANGLADIVVSGNDLQYGCAGSSIGTFTIDTQPPSSITIGGVPASWQNSDASASISSCTDATTACVASSYKLKTYDSSPASCPSIYADYALTSPQTISSNKWVCAAAKDEADNAGFSSPAEFKVDKTAPTITDNYPDSRDGVWVNADQTVTLSPQDTGGSGIDKVWYCDTSIDGSGCTPDTKEKSAPYSFSFTSDVDTIIKYKTKDKAGNPSAQGQFNVKLDKTPPSTTAVLNPAAPDGENEWYLNDVEATLSCDGVISGCASTKYCVDQANSCAPATAYAAPFMITAEGTNYLRFSSTDNAGNTEALDDDNKIQIKLDKTNPTLNVNEPPAEAGVETEIQLTSDSSDAHSKVSYHAIKWDKGDGGQETDCSPATPSGTSSCAYPPVSTVKFTQGTKVTYFAESEDASGRTARAPAAGSKEFTICDLSSATVGMDCGPDGKCATGEGVAISRTKAGNCPATHLLQVDAKSADGLCVLQHSGGTMKGMDMTCSASCSNWVVPSMPLACKGKKITPQAAGIWKTAIAPDAGAIRFAGTTSVSGYFIFGGTVSLTIAKTVDKSNPNLGEGVKIEFEPKITDGVEEMACSENICEVTSIKIDGTECLGNPACAIESKWDGEKYRIEIDTEKHHSDVDASFKYKDTGNGNAPIATGTGSASFTVNFPPAVTGLSHSPSAASLGQNVAFTATITDPESDPITEAKVCKDQSCAEKVYCTLAGTGTYSCTYAVNDDNDGPYFIYAKDSKGAVNNDNGGTFVATDKEISVGKIKYPDAEARVIGAIDAKPVFPKPMPVKFTAEASIGNVLCDGSRCQARYTITTLNGQQSGMMQWDSFLEAWVGEHEYSTGDFSCDTGINNALQIEIEITSSEPIDGENLKGLKNSRASDFKIKCEPTIIIKPKERNLVLGQGGSDAFEVGVWDPLERTFDLSMSYSVPEHALISNWAEFSCTGGCTTAGTLNGNQFEKIAVNNEKVSVKLTASAASKTGIYPLVFTAESTTGDPITLEETGVIMVFAEGLDEFSGMQLAAAFAISLLLFAFLRL